MLGGPLVSVSIFYTTLVLPSLNKAFSYEDDVSNQTKSIFFRDSSTLSLYVFVIVQT